ncbi:MAG: TonB-dependent receptor plug domain-containing protein [Tenuifilaceae bacterium]|nr:TonB-dependent receptor plug domain-containing protein [Tenuifilaceae bacterium]
MKILNLFASVALLLVINLNLNAQLRISGFVRDSLSREVLVGAHVIDSSSMRVVPTDNSGHFSITVKTKSRVTVSYVGYRIQVLDIGDGNEKFIEVLLRPENRIGEVVITHTKRHTHSIASLSNLELQQLPSLGAKPDVMKAIQLLPGIQSQNEGTSTILVRGGNPGENLYLFDNVALIYVNHLGGFTSVFNPDIINNINVYKGGFPSCYGGKLSSIMDIAQREGNASRIKGNYSIGVTDASFVLEGPTSIENSTFIVTGRKTLIDPVIAMASILSGGGDYVLSYGFHDINGKFTWRPDTKNTLSFNLYQGDDYLNYWYLNWNESGLERARLSNLWGNWMLSARWSRVHSPFVYSTQSLSFVRYRLKNMQGYSNNDPDNRFEFKRDFRSLVNDVSYKWDFKAELFQNLSVDFGLQSSFLRFSPNKIFISNNTNLKSHPAINALESTAYAEGKWEIPRWLQLRLGARAVSFFSENYSGFSLEPRATLDILIGSSNSLNVSYMQTSQFAHLLYTQGEIMSNEVWIPAGKDIKPARTEQVSGGWRGSFIKGMWDIEATAYHKSLQDIATYREGYTSLMGDGNWRSKVETGGEGIAYGVEFLVRKTRGSWTGFVGYTWSRATRKFPNINDGREYTFDYDRPNNLSLNLNRKLGSKLTLSATWVLQSGLPFTPVLGRYFIPSLTGESDETYFYEAFIYGEKNSYRMGNYHRLDLALHYTTQTRHGNKAQWTFAIYNAYNKRNPYTYLFTHDTSKENLLIPGFGLQNAEPYSLYQFSFFPILPSLSYKVYFDDLRKSKNSDLVRKNKSWIQFENTTI